jgi:hypothetical protein
MRLHQTFLGLSGKWVCQNLLVAGFFAVPAVVGQTGPGFVLGERSLQIAVPDFDPSGVARTFLASGLDDRWTYDLTVRLVLEGTGFGAFNGDYYAYLSHEPADDWGSGIAILLNRVGRSATEPSGYSDSGFNVSLSDAAAFDIHRYQVSLGGTVEGALSGHWQPDGRAVDPTVSFEGSPRTTRLESLGDLNPNGTWTLFVADLEAGGTGKLVEWEVRGVPRIPEPGSVALLLMGLLIGGLGWRCRR